MAENRWRRWSDTSRMKTVVETREEFGEAGPPPCGSGRKPSLYFYSTTEMIRVLDAIACLCSQGCGFRTSSSLWLAYSFSFLFSTYLSTCPSPPLGCSSPAYQPSHVHNVCLPPLSRILFLHFLFSFGQLMRLLPPPLVSIGLL